MSKRYKSKRNNIKIILLLLLFFILILVIALNLNNQKSKISNETNLIETKNENKDLVAPEITLAKEKVILAIGQKYNEINTATDNIDGDVSSKIVTNDIDTSTTGTKEITISVTDSSGNKAEVKQNVEVREELTNGLPVLMYHFFYDDVTYKRKDNNWHNIKAFEEQLKYLTENNYNFPTWKEVEQYIDGEIKLPSKSIVLTSDDGDQSFFDLAVPVMQKYKVPVTSFVITGWYAGRYDKNLKYVVWESHSSDMHEAGANGKGRMVNWDYEQIIADVKKSSNDLGGADIFCYPFGHYNDTAIKALKDANFKMAFTIGNGRVKPGMDKYKLPRVRMSDGMSLNSFISRIS